MSKAQKKIRRSKLYFAFTSRKCSTACWWRLASGVKGSESGGLNRNHFRGEGSDSERRGKRINKNVMAITL
jgi:hypothetical protein